MTARRVHNRSLHFARLNSALATERFPLVDLPPDYDSSVVLLRLREDGSWSATTEGMAVLESLRRVRFPMRLLSIARYLPQGPINWVYRGIAKRRERLPLISSPLKPNEVEALSLFLTP